MLENKKYKLGISTQSIRFQGVEKYDLFSQYVLFFSPLLLSWNQFFQPIDT